MGKHIINGLQPLLSKLGDMVCSCDEVHQKLKSSKLQGVLTELEKEDFDALANEWNIKVSEAISIFTGMLLELERIENNG